MPMRDTILLMEMMANMAIKISHMNNKNRLNKYVANMEHNLAELRQDLLEQEQVYKKELGLKNDEPVVEENKVKEEPKVQEPKRDY